MIDFLRKIDIANLFCLLYRFLPEFWFFCVTRNTRPRMVTMGAEECQR
jgi:hypothetical protein